MKMILTAVGRDRPGIVASVSKVLFETGCNIEDSSMTQLGGEFAMMLLVNVTGDLPPDAVLEKLKSIEKEWGLFFSLRALEGKGETACKQGTRYILSVYGADHPGIVYGVTDLVAQKKVNITDVNTQVIGEKDAPVYCMILEVEVLSETDVKDLQRALEAKAESLKVDISFREADPVEL